MTEEVRSDEVEQLRGRVERLEAEVARLGAASQESASPPRAAPAPRPPALVPAMAEAVPVTAAKSAAAAPPPQRERNPVVVIAALGAGIFLLGAIFLLRFAIQQGWIGAELRFLFGLAVGGGLAALATRHLLAGAHGLGTALLAAGLGTLEFTFYVGALRYDFYPVSVGFALAALGCLAAGALAARVRVEGTFLVTYVAAFLAPFVFSTGAHQLIELSAYALALFASSILVAHLAPEARRWGFTRWAVSGSQALLQLGVAAGSRRSDESMLLVELAIFLALGVVWIWRPVDRAQPATSPTLLWGSLSLAGLAALAQHWHQLERSSASFALPVLLFAAMQLALVRPARRGWAPPGGEIGLMVLAGALITVSVPIALDWRWVGPLWGLLAVGALLGSRILARGGAELQSEARALALCGFGLTVATTARWAFALGGRDAFARLNEWPFANQLFVTAALAAVAWALIARAERELQTLAVVALEVVANLAVALEIAALLGRWGGSERAQLVTLTLVWAVSGAGQWLVGLRHADPDLRRALVGAGYAGLAVAAGKLVFVDMAEATLALRALVFLAAGAIFLGAALAAHRLAPPG